MSEKVAKMFEKCQALIQMENLKDQMMREFEGKLKNDDNTFTLAHQIMETHDDKLKELAAQTKAAQEATARAEQLDRELAQLKQSFEGEKSKVVEQVRAQVEAQMRADMENIRGKLGAQIQEKDREITRLRSAQDEDVMGKLERRLLMKDVVNNNDKDEGERTLRAEAQQLGEKVRRLEDELQRSRREVENQQRKFQEQEEEIKKIKEGTEKKLLESTEEREKEIAKYRRQKEHLVRAHKKEMQEQRENARELMEQHIKEKEESTKRWAAIVKEGTAYSVAFGRAVS